MVHWKYNIFTAFILIVLLLLMKTIQRKFTLWRPIIPFFNQIHHKKQKRNIRLIQVFVFHSKIKWKQQTKAKAKKTKPYTLSFFWASRVHWMALTHRIPHLLDKLSCLFSQMVRSLCKSLGAGLHQEGKGTLGSYLSYLLPWKQYCVCFFASTPCVRVTLGLGLFTWRKR